RRGYTEIVRVDAAKVKALWEEQQGEKLPWNAGRNERLRQLEGPVHGYPIVSASGLVGQVDVGDGRHRIALAAERGQTIDVALQPGPVRPAALTVKRMQLRGAPDFAPAKRRNGVLVISTRVPYNKVRGTGVPA